jgi:Family of unknown function (DUF5519)
MSTMKIAAKGRFVPPPRLPPHAQDVSVELATWEGVTARTHWHLGDETVVDGADFYVGDEELGHLHLDGTAHIVAARPIRDALVAAGLAKPFTWSKSFVVVSAKRPTQIEHALWVFALRYDALRGAARETLLARIAAKAA